MKKVQKRKRIAKKLHEIKDFRNVKELNKKESKYFEYHHSQLKKLQGVSENREDKYKLYGINCTNYQKFDELFNLRYCDKNHIAKLCEKFQRSEN